DELIRQVVGAGAVWIAGGRTGPDRAEAETVISRDRRVGVLGDGARSEGLPRGGEIGPGLPGRDVGGRHTRLTQRVVRDDHRPVWRDIDRREEHVVALALVGA